MKSIIAILLCFLMLLGCAYSPNNGMDINAFSIGKADCIFLSFDGINVLIDVGEEDDGELIAQKLLKSQVKKLDLVILTHFDKDHIGGFKNLADTLPIEYVIIPNYVRDSDLFRVMETSLEKHNIAFDRLSTDTSFRLGPASFTIWVSTVSYNPEEENDNQMSLITAITYGQIRLLSMADAEGAWMKDLCYRQYDLGCDIIKFPCHGKWQRNIPVLLALSLPEYAIVTDSDKNPADINTIDALTTLGITTLRTKIGDIHLFTDGRNVEVR